MSWSPRHSINGMWILFPRSPDIKHITLCPIIGDTPTINIVRFCLRAGCGKDSSDRQKIQDSVCKQHVVR
jgi:hypothetical protein